MAPPSLTTTVTLRLPSGEMRTFVVPRQKKKASNERGARPHGTTSVYPRSRHTTKAESPATAKSLFLSDGIGRLSATAHREVTFRNSKNGIGALAAFFLRSSLAGVSSFAPAATQARTLSTSSAFGWVDF